MDNFEPHQTKKVLWRRPEIIIGSVAIIIGVISIPWWPNWWMSFFRTDKNNLSQVLQSVATSSINLSDIFDGYNAKTTSYDKQNFLHLYDNGKVYGSGYFLDISKPTDRYLVSLDVSDNLISCFFSSESETERRLFLLKKNQIVNFTGVFTNSAVWGGGWKVDNCILLN
ncbi:MAG: hypothetical protein WCT19_03075 [Candidatus Paceibacterota bacterium]|jgi:hypothetical protein